MTSPIHSENFSTVTVPALPSGWSAESGVTAATTVASGFEDSSPNCLQLESVVAPAFLDLGFSDSNGGDVSRQDFVKYTGGGGIYAVILRGSGTSFATIGGYAFSTFAVGDGSGGVSILRFVGGANTPVASTGNGTEFSAGEVYRILSQAKGDVLSMAIQRASDGKWFAAGIPGTWSSTPQFALIFTDTDPSAVSGSGHLGNYWFAVPGNPMFAGKVLYDVPFATGFALSGVTTPVVVGSDIVGTVAPNGPPAWDEAVVITDDQSNTLATKTFTADSATDAGQSFSSAAVTGQIGTRTLTATPTPALGTAPTASVTVASDGVPAVSPGTLSLDLGATHTLTASGFTGEAVTWASGNTARFTINASTGVATCVGPGAATITATGVADHSQTATATLTGNTVAVSISPSSVGVDLSGTQQFTATVTGAVDTAVTWTQAGGTGVSSSGLFTALGTAGSASVTATSAADATKSATATVSVAAMVTVQSQVDLGGGYAGWTGTASVSTKDGTTETVVSTGLAVGELSTCPGSFFMDFEGVPGTGYVVTYTLTNTFTTINVADGREAAVAGELTGDQQEALSRLLGWLPADPTSPIGNNPVVDAAFVNGGPVVPFDGVLQSYRTSGGSSVVKLADTEPAGTAYGVGRLFETVGGAGSKQYGYGTAYDGSTKELTLDRLLAVALDDTTEYAITAPLPVGSVDMVQIEAGLNMRQAMSLHAAASAGVVSGAGTGVVVVKGANTSSARITSNVDDKGNRISITLNLPT